jgi:hypothetical protein
MAGGRSVRQGGRQNLIPQKESSAWHTWHKVCVRFSAADHVHAGSIRNDGVSRGWNAADGQAATHLQ